MSAKKKAAWWAASINRQRVAYTTVMTAVVVLLIGACITGVVMLSNAAACPSSNSERELSERKRKVGISLLSICGTFLLIAMAVEAPLSFIWIAIMFSLIGLIIAAVVLAGAVGASITGAVLLSKPCTEESKTPENVRKLGVGLLASGGAVIIIYFLFVLWLAVTDLFTRDASKHPYISI
jgi:hypothetical protein